MSKFLTTLVIITALVVGANYYFDLGLWQFAKQYVPEKQVDKIEDTFKKSTEAVGARFFSSNPPYNSATTSAHTLSGTTDAQVLASSTGANKRAYAAFVNNCTDKIFLSMNNDKKMALNVNEGIMITANGGSYEITGDNMYFGAVRASSSSACELLVFEGRR